MLFVFPKSWISVFAFILYRCLGRRISGTIEKTELPSLGVIVVKFTRSSKPESDNCIVLEAESSAPTNAADVPFAEIIFVPSETVTVLVFIDWLKFTNIALYLSAPPIHNLGFPGAGLCVVSGIDARSV